MKLFNKGGIEVDYIKNNKAAWEEAFERRRHNWGDDTYITLINEKLPFLNADVVSELENINLNGKTILSILEKHQNY
jgi:hypothetical protein